MKKAFKFFFYSSFLLFILLILITFFGWVRFDYPNTYRGVVYYKTSGYQTKLITPFKWNWNWQHIFPENTKIYIVDLNPIKESFEKKGELPSAETYATLIDNIEKFNYSFSFNYQYKLKESTLTQLFSKNILQESLNVTPLNNLIKEDIEKMWKDKVNNILIEKDLSALTSFISEWEKEVTLKIKEDFYYINDFSLNVNINTFPDISLYQKAKEIMDIFIKEKEEEKKQEEIKKAEQIYKEDQRLFWLEKYGKLLKEYPELSPLLSSDNLKLFPFFSQEEMEE